MGWGRGRGKRERKKFGRGAVRRYMYHTRLMDMEMCSGKRGTMTRRCLFGHTSVPPGEQTFRVVPFVPFLIAVSA